MAKHPSNFPLGLIKEFIRGLFHKMGQSAPWLAKIFFYISYPFPRVSIFISHAAGLTHLFQRRTWRFYNGHLQGIKLTGLLEEEIRPVLNNKMEVQCCNLLERIVLTDKIVLDVGGSFGYYALFLAKLVGDGGLVFSFEPDWHSFARLTNNIIINAKHNIIAVPFCISNRSSGYLRWQSFPDEPWKNKLIENSFDIQSPALNAVPVTTLDTFVDFLNLSDKIGLIKIDVEGAELTVLQGARKLLAAAEPLILCELHAPEIAEQVFAFLKDLDYTWDVVEYMNEYRQHILSFPVNQAEGYRQLILEQQGL